MMMNEFAGTVRSQKRGSILFAAAVLLIVCVLAVGAVSADTVTVSSFAELQSNISSASGERTIIVAGGVSISDTLTIDNGKTITLRADGTDRTLSRDGFTGNLFTVNSGGNLTITGSGTSNLTLNGTGQASNSLVYVNGGSFTLADGGILTNNMVPGSNGGGVYVNAGTFTMSGGEISNNKAKDNGGGVYVNAGTFTMSGGTISGNTIYSTLFGSCGGGVYVGNGEFTMSGTAKISSNTAYTGGGVYVNDGTFTMSGGEISKNKASNGGGGVYVKDGMFTMSGGTISNNDYEATSGGGVYVGSGGTFTMSGGTITNHMVRYGGGVYVGNGEFTMSGTAKISSNTADIGGGVNMYGGTFTMSGGTISNNKANEWWGGGVYGTDGSTFMMESGTISDNTASEGGGVYLNRGTFEMESGTISDNTANGDGGGVYVNYDGEFEMSSGTISDNTASEGGGVYVIGIFELSGSSSVDSVYLTSDKVINVTGELTGTGPQVTDINLQSPVHGTKVVTISPSVPEPNYLNYFQLNASLERFELEYLSPDIVLMNTYTVSFDTQGGSTVPAQTVSHGEMVNKPADPTKDGFTFTNWYNESACLNLWDFTTPVTKDLTLYAKWTPNEPGPEPPSGSSGDGNMENAYRVLFNDGATTLYVVTDLSAGDKLTKPEDPVKDGYTFAGWHKDSACTQAWDFNDGITGDMTLYAKWTAQATVTPTVTPTATATVTPTVTATATATATPTGDASPAQTSQPDNEGSNGETTATSGISLPYLIGGIAIVILAILLLLFLFLRHTVTFLIPTGGELEEYRIKVWHGRYINTEDLPALIRTAAWYRDPARQERWDFDQDRVKKSIELYIG